MAGIAIVGSTLAGLHLALYLQQAGVDTTVYAPSPPDGSTGACPPGFALRFPAALSREWALEADHWPVERFGELSSVALSVDGRHPLRFAGRLPIGAQALDQRAYLSRLTQDYRERDGRVVTGALERHDLVAVAGAHDLLVLTDGRAAAELLPRDRNVSSRRQARLVCAGLYRGVRAPDPVGLTIAITPGIGMVVHVPVQPRNDDSAGVVFTGPPGGPFNALVTMRYAEDPTRFHATVLELLAAHAPTIAAHVDRAAFRLIDPAALLQAEVPPTGRRTRLRLGETFALAIGAASPVADPLTLQQATLDARAAWAVGEAILADAAFDEVFCRTVERRLAEHADPVIRLANLLLRPPPHVLALVAAAERHSAVADAVATGLAEPATGWKTFATPERVAATLHRLSAGPTAVRARLSLAAE